MESESTMDDEHDELTIADAAKEFGLPAQALRAALCRGTLRSSDRRLVQTISKRVMLRRADVAAFVARTNRKRGRPKKN